MTCSIASKDYLEYGILVKASASAPPPKPWYFQRWELRENRGSQNYGQILLDLLSIIKKLKWSPQNVLATH